MADDRVRAKGGRRRRSGPPPWRRWLAERARRAASWRIAVALPLGGALFLTAFLGVGYARTPLPTEPKDGVTDQGSVVYYADGSTPIMRLGANREVVGHDRIPDRVRWAVLAAEDRGFHTEPGVSLRGMIRALWANATGGQVQGASTVTQQLARNYYRDIGDERTFDRKFREVFAALKLDRHRSKDEILDLYLNTVYFGRQASGVQAAARAYFHKDVRDVTVAEAAMLAAMIQQPAYFQTRGDDPPARALRARWRYVVDGMVAMGRLDRAEAARLTFPRTRPEWRAPDPTGQRPLIAQRVQEELRLLGIPMERVVNGGLKIYTTLDRRWMEYAAQAVRETDEHRWPKSVRGGLVAVDPRTGGVRAFYGGDTRRSQYDAVFNPVAQAASTFKPYVLAAALRENHGIRSVVDGSSPRKFAPDGRDTPMTAPGYLVHNDEKIGSVGRVNLVQATALSVNTGYVELGYRVGIDDVVRTAQDFGVPGHLLAPFRRQAGVVLGTATIPAVHQAAGYAAFANGGTAVTPHLITRIVDANGRALPLPRRSGGRRVLSEEQAAQVSIALQATLLPEGTGHRAALGDRAAAGKTGATDRNRAAWFVGYVPQLSAAVVMADTSGRPLRLPGHSKPVDGGTVPAAVWRSFMEKVTADLPVEPLPGSAAAAILARTPVPGAASQTPAPQTPAPRPPTPLPRPDVRPSTHPTPTPAPAPGGGARPGFPSLPTGPVPPIGPVRPE